MFQNYELRMLLLQQIAVLNKNMETGETILLTFLFLQEKDVVTSLNNSADLSISTEKRCGHITKRKMSTSKSNLEM